MGTPPPPPLPDEHEKRTLAIRERYKRFLMERLGRAEKSPGRVAFGVLLCLSGVLIPVGLILIFQGLRGRVAGQDKLDEELAFTDRAEAVMAYPLMVNSMLRRPGEQAAPGLVIVTFDRGAPQSIGYMAEVAIAVGTGGNDDTPPDDRTFLESLMADEEYHRSRRRKLPASITQGHMVYACDLGIPPWYLPNRHIHDEMPFIPCLAEPGDAGQLRVIPYWCAFEIASPPWAAEAKVAVM